MLPFRFGAVTDELDDDLDRALSIARDLGITAVELNQVWGQNVVELPESAVARAERILGAGKARVIAIAPSCFKPCVLDHLPVGRVAEDPEVARHLELLERALALARRFDALFVRVFSFRRSGIVGLGNPSPRPPDGGSIPEEMLDRIAEGLREAARRAEEAGVTLVLENVRSCWANTGVNTAAVLEAVDSPALRALWDPANDFVSGGVPYPNGYEAVRPHMLHVHVKDARVVDAAAGLTAWAPIGEGEVDYQGQIRALLEDGYPGVLALETHWRPAGGSAESASRQSFAGLRALVREMADSASGAV
jgi:sugar phosphate isomerase/epimerase